MSDSETKIVEASPLSADLMYRRCDPEQFGFETTAELEKLEEVVGQERALGALEFGVRMGATGYNLYVLGPPGASRHATVQRFLDKEAAKGSRPDDWCYANNFEDAQNPVALRLPPGRGPRLCQDMIQLVEELKVSLPAAFESEDYRNRLAEIDQEFEERAKKAIEELHAAAESRGMGLLQTPMGFAIAPVKDGQVIAQEDFELLPEEEKEQAQKAIAELGEELKKHIERLPKWRRERRERVKELNRETTLAAVGVVIQELKDDYRDLPKVTKYLEDVEKDVIEHARDFVKRSEEALLPSGVKAAEGRPAFSRYEINVIVHNGEQDGAPVVYESNPTFQNLVGRIEHTQQFGALVTDFSMIRAGALHKANGGYLVLDVDRLLIQPFAYQGLKRALFNRAINVESLAQMLSWVSTVSLEPETIPLDVKVVLIGNRLIYYLLNEFDPEFGELFKVAADFEDSVERDERNTELYARLIATIASNRELRPFDRGAVARVIEHSARVISDSEKLSTHMRSITDLLEESNHWAGVEGRDVIAAEHIQKAIDQQIYRLDRLRELHRDEILRDTVLIDTAGEAVGQVNGLAVTQIGMMSFGAPTRITATVRTGEGEIVDIEREIELGGAIHSKGVLILSSFLGSRYGTRAPLSLSASLVFEQTYGGVEGDSASVAESCALLSALANTQIKQTLAVTGSVNQHGRVQVIGGVNEKIEGFFDICKARGLSGEHGVLIPVDNVKHLMLRRDVVEACEAGRFHIYPVKTIDQALTLLTGVEAGERDASGVFPDETVNRRVEDRLEELAKIRHEFAEKKSSAEESKESKDQQSE